MKEKLIKLIDLKTIITLLLTVTFVYLTVDGQVDGKDFFTVLLITLNFYFNKKKEN